MERGVPSNKELQRAAMRRQRRGLSEVYVHFRVAVSARAMSCSGAT